MKLLKILLPAAVLLPLASCAAPRESSLIFDPVGGVFGDGSAAEKTLRGRSGQRLAESDVPTVSQEKKYFKGWYEKSDISGNPLAEFYYPYLDVRLYAGWADEVTVSYVTGVAGTSVPDSVGYAGLSYQLPEVEIDNHSLLGWYSNPELTSVFTGDVFPDADLTLYAMFEAYPELRLHYSSEEVITHQAKAGSLIEREFANPTREGYTFKGWYQDQAFTSRFYFDRMPGISLDLFPKFVKEVVLTFESNGGTAVASLTGEAGSECRAPAVPSREGYTFDGWYADVSLTEKFLFEAFPDGDLQLYAKWTAYPSLTFETGGLVDLAPIVQAPGTVLAALPTPSVAGQEFLYWYVEDASGQPQVFDETVMPESSLVLHARFQQMRKVTIYGQTTEEYFLETAQTSITGSWWSSYFQAPEGYVENGLFADGAYLTPIDLPHNPSGDLAIYVRLAKIVTVSFVDPTDSQVLATLSGGANMSMPIDDPAFVAAIRKDGFEVEGFYVDQAYQNSFAAKLFPSGDLTVYVRYLAA